MRLGKYLFWQTMMATRPTSNAIKLCGLTLYTSMLLLFAPILVLVKTSSASYTKNQQIIKTKAVYKLSNLNGGCTSWMEISSRVPI